MTGIRLPKRTALLLALVLLGSALAWRASVTSAQRDALGPAATGVMADSVATVAYPDGYRTWAHVKSTLIGPEHRMVETVGGFQHIYANELALRGYRTRAFPEGSVVAFDWLAMRDSSGAFSEGPRRQLDVMAKDSVRFASTGGWGFQRFVKDSKTELASAPAPRDCFACHDRLKQDGLILSTYRR